MARRRWSWRTYLLIGGACLLAQAGCGEADERRQWREAAEVSSENRREREADHREALPALRQLQSEIVSSPDLSAGCSKKVRAGARPVSGVAPVACGNMARGWPLIVDFGFLRCLEAAYAPPENKYVVITVPSGRDFAINRAARYVGYSSIAPIFKRGTGPRYDSALVDIGLRLCR